MTIINYTLLNQDILTKASELIGEYIAQGKPSYSIEDDLLRFSEYYNFLPQLSRQDRRQADELLRTIFICFSYYGYDKIKALEFIYANR